MGRGWLARLTGPRDGLATPAAGPPRGMSADRAYYANKINKKYVCVSPGVMGDSRMKAKTNGEGNSAIE